MTPLTCPHCHQGVAANPVGRWFARFQCPHCHAMLQFDQRTNLLGAAGSACFFIAAWAVLMGGTEEAHAVAWGAGALWLAAMGASYSLRRIEKG